MLGVACDEVVATSNRKPPLRDRPGHYPAGTNCQGFSMRIQRSEAGTAGIDIDRQNAFRRWAGSWRLIRVSEHLAHAGFEHLATVVGRTDGYIHD